MIQILALIAVLTFSSATFAQDASCTARSTQKKLAGAAKTSFMKKCEKDATAVCEVNSAEKKLKGAAKNSFTRKCIKDSVG